MSGGGADVGLPLVRLDALLPGEGDLVSLDTVLTQTLVRAGREAACKERMSTSCSRVGPYKVVVRRGSHRSRSNVSLLLVQRFPELIH